MILLLILLINILSCSGYTDFNEIGRNFSIGLVESIGSDHVVLCSFGIWTMMLSTAIWTHESLDAGTAYKNQIIQDIVKIRNAVLDFEPNTSKVEFENFIFINKDFHVLPEFRETMTTHFKAHIKDFSSNRSTELANDANGVIRSVSPVFRHVFHPTYFTNFIMNMASVLLFRGTWTSPFETGLTTLKATSDVTRSEKIMHQKIKIPYSYIEEIKANAMELSFGNTGKYCMLIIKPDPEVKLMETFKELKKYTLIKIMDKLEKDVNELGLKEIDLTLPNFITESALNLNKPLIDMGVDDVFRSDASNFPGISEDDVYISSVEHKAYLYVNETGVTAFASTPGINLLPSNTLNLKSSEPFIFFILEKPSVTVIFSGLHSIAYIN